MSNDKKFLLSMFLLRISIFIVMLMWTLDKFINPEHAAKVFEKFYYIAGLGNTIIYAIGAVEIVILLLFFVGIKKKLTYGAVLAFHSVSTLSAFSKYLSPFDGGLLFFAAWPMLAACVTLFLLRGEDTMFQIESKPLQNQ